MKRADEKTLKLAKWLSSVSRVASGLLAAERELALRVDYATALRELQIKHRALQQEKGAGN